MEEFAIMNTPEGEIYNTSLLQRLVHELVWDGVRDENPYIRMTETRFYEPARLSTPPKPLFSLKLLDADLVEVIVI